MPEIPGTRCGKTGYVALIGRPNTGKSTLLNTLLKRHLAAVSPKPQTTRRHLLGIYTDADAQMLFLDAPGIHKPRLAHDEALDEAMNRSINRVMEDADIILCLVDPTRAPGEEDALAVDRVAAAGKKAVIAVNKIDIASPEQIEKSLAFYSGRLAEAPTIRIAAVSPERTAPLLSLLKSLLPSGPFMYDENEITDVYERDIAAEFIREALLELLRQEVPHCIAVTVDKWTDKGKSISIGATLHIEREAHKAIVIGRGGTMIRNIRLAAVRKISEFTQSHVDLSLFVKLSEDWRSNKRFLSENGLE